MSKPAEIRRLAFLMLFEMDARGESDALAVRDALETPRGMSDKEAAKAFDLALAAYQERSKADAAMTALAPDWPVHRQAAVDRAILRLAHFEITTERTAGAVVINEAVELAKEFSTEKSPAFVNALLDKVLKATEGGQSAEAAP